MNIPPSTGSIAIDAPPDEVYRLVSDPEAMLTFTEETFRIRWLDGADRAAVGTRFEGFNRSGRHRWRTVATVTDATPGRRFAYEVAAPFGMRISRWQYDIEPTGDDGCTVTETAWIRAPVWFIPFAIAITGRANRPAVNSSNIAATLERLKRHAEAQTTR